MSIKNDDKISYTEFVAFHLDNKDKLTKENLKEVFNWLDVD